MQALVDENDDDGDDDFDIVNLFGVEGAMTWNMWRLPDSLMPPFGPATCQPPVRRVFVGSVGPGYASLEDIPYHQEHRDDSILCSRNDTEP